MRRKLRILSDDELECLRSIARNGNYWSGHEEEKKALERLGLIRKRTPDDVLPRWNRAGWFLRSETFARYASILPSEERQRLLAALAPPPAQENR